MIQPRNAHGGVWSRPRRTLASPGVSFCRAYPRESPGAFAISNPGARPPLKITAAKITYQNVTEYLCSQTPECAGGRIVLAKQYRELADECLASAKTARTDKERRIFLQMAETWLRAAMLAEQGAHKQLTAAPELVTDCRRRHHNKQDREAYDD
jgi:hypothetical protein